MRAQNILIFTILVIACLAFICFLFPSQGIVLFQKTLRFPTLTEILTRSAINDEDPEEILKRWEFSALVEKMDTLNTSAHEARKEDTIKYMEAVFKMMESTFELPDGNRAYFDTFFQRSEAARAQHKVVRVLYYGDSQIELDRFSAQLRNFFQEKFGGGGPNMVPFHQTIPTWAVHQNYSGNYTAFSLWGEGRKNKDGDYGPLAKMYRIDGNNTFSASAPNRRGEFDRRDNYSNISLLINNLNGTFKAELFDNIHETNYSLQTDLHGIQLLEFPLSFSTQSFSISMNGNANIYGVLIDDAFGVAVDNIAMRGANGLHFTSMQDSLMRLTYGLLNVGMIIMQFGGNAVPGLSGAKSVEMYVTGIISQIKYLQHVAPNVPILFVGPADMLSMVDGELKTYKHLPYLVEKLSEEIPKAGVAFWNMYHVMGGDNSMRSWVKKGWAGNDYVHFTTKGAYELAHVLSQTFETMYGYYQLRMEN